MMKFRLYNLLLIAVLAISFTACDNEPLEGEFLGDGSIVVAEPGQFVARIDGQNFSADIISAVLTTDGVFTISGVNAVGDSISMTIVNGDNGFHDLGGLLNANAGTYTRNQETPYVSTQFIGGSGSLRINPFDTNAQIVSGVFDFVGVRAVLDESGNPVLDGNGDLVVEKVNVTDGSFNTIPYVIDSSGGGGSGGGGGGTVVPNLFDATVDGEEFLPDTITATRYDVAGISMVKIEANMTSGASIRIDIPENTGEGTFPDLVRVSNGTERIGLYNAGMGGENLTSDPGTITITDFNTATGKIIANFSFRATDPLVANPPLGILVAGNFNVNYIPIQGTTNVFFRADVDGNEYSADSVNAAESVFNGVSIITISTVSETQNLGLVVPLEIPVGVFPMSNTLITGNELIGLYTPDNTDPVVFTSNPGSIEITEHNRDDRYIVGTFTFTAVDLTGGDPTTYSITNGEFYAEY